MDKLKISTAQFENKSGDKSYNLSVIEKLSEKASKEVEDSFATATITSEKLIQAGGYRYIKARRPELYKDIIGQHHKSEQKVVWPDNK